MHKGIANTRFPFFCKRHAMSEIQKEQTLEEKWENATIANNFIFYKVMRNNPDVCQGLGRSKGLQH